MLDDGSLQILGRIGQLEELIKTILPRSHSASHEPQLGTALTRKRQVNATTEEVLSWTVFKGRYDSRRSLKTLLRTRTLADAATSPARLDLSCATSNIEQSLPQRMVDNFFHSIHVKNPMLDEVAITRSVHQMLLNGPSWDAECCLVLVICALGSLASSFDTDFGSSDLQMAAVAASYFDAAQRRLGMMIGSGGVLEAQCFFYSGVYMMSKLEPLRAWRFFCQALACCQDFACADPLYQNQQCSVRTAQSLPAEECVYWSCWKSDLELRAVLELPDFVFHDCSYPVLFPTPPESLQDQQTTSWYFYLSEISLRRLEHQVRRNIAITTGASDKAFLAELDQTTRAAESLAEEWTHTLPIAMSLQTQQADDNVLKFILRGHLLNLWEVIYWPWLLLFIHEQVHTPEVMAYAAKGLQIAIDRIRVNKPGFHHRHHGTWLMLQSCTRSALILLAAAYITGPAELLPSGWSDAVAETTELLRYWQRGAGDTADRLNILEELRAGLR